MSGYKKDKKAVALKYNRSEDTAPKVVAKGRGYLAEKIEDVAKEHNIPLYEDRELAQMLEALNLNTEIPEDLYAAVAEVLAFIYRLNKSFEGR